MRILLFCDEDLRAASGGSRQVLEIARALAHGGHEVQIVAPASSGPPSDARFVPPGMIHEVPVLRGLGLRPLSYLVRSLLHLTRLFRGWRPDVLLWFDAPGQVSPWLGARAARCPYVLFVNGLPAEEVRGVWAWPPVLALVNGALKLAARHAAAIVSVCPEILDWMQHAWAIPPDRCYVVQNGVDPERFRPRERTAARRALGLDPDGSYVGFVGGFFPWHGVDRLLEAAPTVLEAVPACQFLLVGDGPERAAMEHKARALGLGPSVRFPGRAEYDQVPTWIAACDVCVVLHRPTRFYAGDSMKLREYLACGRPIVTSLGPGYGDLIHAYGCGRAVHIDDIRALGGELVKLLQNPAVCDELGQRGRAAVAEHHTWAARARVLERVLRDKIAARLERH